MERKLDAVVLALLCALVAWAPLPFGSVTRGGQAALQVGLFVTLSAVLLARLAGDRGAASARPVLVSASALFAVALLGFLQSLAWPSAVVAVVSPGHLAAYQRMGELSGALAPALSLAPLSSRAAALTWAAVASAMMAGALVGSLRVRRRALGASIVAAAGLQVAFGASHLLGRADTIWGIEVNPSRHRLRGTFINPDHLATYLLLALALCLAWLVASVARGREEPIDRRIALVAPPALAWVTLFVAIAFTGSRGGMTAAVFGTLAQGVLVALQGRRVRATLVGVGVALAGLAAVAVIGLQEGFGRFMASSSVEAGWELRARVYALVPELWRLFPWTGTGLGSFREAFPLVQPADLTGGWFHAHSDLLELLATAGVAGVALLAVGTAALLWRLGVVLLRGERTEDRAAAVAALGALAAVALHATVEFGLTMPATGMTLAILCGAAAAAPTRSR